MDEHCHLLDESFLSFDFGGFDLVHFDQEPGEATQVSCAFGMTSFKPYRYLHSEAHRLPPLVSLLCRVGGQRRALPQPLIANKGIVVVEHVPSEENPSDGLSKVLNESNHRKCTDKMLYGNNT